MAVPPRSRSLPLLPTTLVAALLVAACGAPEATQDGSRSPDTVGPGADRVEAGAVEARLEADPLTPPPGEPVSLTLVVTNPGAGPVALDFPTGQRVDFRIERPGGEVLARWSEGRMFTQVLGTDTLPPGPPVTYEGTLAAPDEAGSYLVVGHLAEPWTGVADTVSLTVR